MSDKTSDDLERWKEKRKLGGANFILLYGVVYWGISTGLLSILIGGWLRGFTVSNILVALIVWPISGACYGAVMWSTAERKYRLSMATSGRNA